MCPSTGMPAFAAASITTPHQIKVSVDDGDDQVNQGVRLHRTGGHSAGLQFVSIHTKRGWVVIASDTSHYYEHMESYRPFTIAFHVGEMMESYDKLKLSQNSTSVKLNQVKLKLS